MRRSADHGSRVRVDSPTTRLDGPKARLAGPTARFAGPTARFDGRTSRLDRPRPWRYGPRVLRHGRVTRLHDRRLAGRFLPCLALLLALAPILAAPAAAQPARGLQGASRLALEIAIAPEHPGPPAEELEQRIREGLRDRRPAPVLDQAATDRLHLWVSVRPTDATELRGFWLPLSGTYAIGPVRLAVERRATLPGVRSPVPAVVWQAERQVKGPWHRAARDILVMIDDLLETFLEEYARAQVP